MRKEFAVAGLLTLTACQGGGPTTPSSVALNSANNAAGHSFVNPTQQKTYSAIGGVQRYDYSTDDRDADPGTPGTQHGSQYGQRYAGNATTARNSSISITYNPRDAIFDLIVADTNAGITDSLRFQDPAHRTDFGGAHEPQEGVPPLPTSMGINFLQAGGISGPARFDPSQSDTFQVGDGGSTRDVTTFFYQKPGTKTNFVTFAGFVRNLSSVSQITETTGETYLRQTYALERGAFAYGERADNGAVPTSGSATFTGDLLATMVYNPLIDTQSDAPTYYQWVYGNGTAVTTVNFGAKTFSTKFDGIVSAPGYDVNSTRTHVLDAGATFHAEGGGGIDLVGAGGFKGQMTAAGFQQGGAPVPVNIAGSSIDGAFFGPNAQEVGGGFRIVGGTPDERIDITGAFTGKR